MLPQLIPPPLRMPVPTLPITDPTREWVVFQFILALCGEMLAAFLVANLVGAAFAIWDQWERDR